MMTINCIIIDDEPLARKGLKEYIADVDFLQLTGEFDNPVKAMDLLAKEEVQLLFLDIQMPKITGLDFFKTLKYAPPVIFTTAFPQFALEGFELNALDYLVKPVSFERFLKAAMRAKEYYEVRQKNSQGNAPGIGTPEYFFIKADGKLVKIAYEDILFVEALQNYVVIQTREKKYITYLTFKAIEDYLPSDKFIKTHKSYIISASKVDSIEANDIRIAQHHIPISRNLKDEVMEKLVNGKFLRR
ncbi:MAG TPA: LytTR family DNA-binding domain-containing protein [Chitinophagaceae bacterium]|nr:LytTR family DNA-binding domain-containing protein [Chitinophagaceae bacterium]